MRDERLDAARDDAAKAAREAIARYQPGAIVTGYLTAVEYIDQGGQIQVWWFTGTGSDVLDEDQAGLPAHRAAGILWKVSSDIESNRGHGEG